MMQNKLFHALAIPQKIHIAYGLQVWIQPPPKSKERVLDDNKSDLPTNIKFAGIYEKIVRKNTSYLN
jgi:hypothetical protein